jgi:opacity protein-like surface antigen
MVGAVIATPATTVAILSSPAFADSTSPFYLAGYLGLNTFGDSNKFSENTTPRSGDLGFGNSPSFAGALGVRLTEQWRVEAELGYRKSDVTHATFDGFSGQRPMGGRLKTMTLLVNTFYDFDLGWDRLTPYVGAGVGLARHSGKIQDGSGLSIDSSGDDIGLAWQLGTGLKLKMSDDVSFSGDYRYLGTTDFNMGAYESEFGSHEFRLGIVYDLPIDWLE